ncbi:hypothetical protein [Nocardia nova]|uniref:hypothetical protein n=1 Tax=Nocardia nova TaxID=37330 RepID=UPI0033D6153A
MTRTASLFALPMFAVAAAGCSGNVPWPDKTPTTVPGATGYTIVETVPPTGAEAEAGMNTELRARSCRDMLPTLDRLRENDPAAASKSAENTIAELSENSEWWSLSQADRDAKAAGIRDAATGQCPG